jgi:hypothetical protein
VSKRSGFYPCPAVDTAGSNVVSQAGATLLTETVRAVGLDRALSGELARWRHPNAVHDPAKIVLDPAVTLTLGGDCLADIALLRAEPGLFGRVASDPTVSRIIDRLAGDAAAGCRWWWVCSVVAAPSPGVAVEGVTVLGASPAASRGTGFSAGPGAALRNSCAARHCPRRRPLGLVVPSATAPARGPEPRSTPR